MLCCSPSNMDTMDTSPSLFMNAYDSPDYSDDIDSFSKDDLLAYLRGHPATSSQCVNNFIQSSDVFESISYIDNLPAYADGLIEGFNADDLLDTFAYNTDSSPTDYTDSSATTSPNISPNYESQEVVFDSKKMVYWEDRSAEQSCPPSLPLQDPALISQSDGFLNLNFSVPDNKTVDSFLNIDSIKKEPVDFEGLDSAACVMCKKVGNCVCLPDDCLNVKEDDISLDFFNTQLGYSVDAIECDFSNSESVLIHPAGGDVLLGNSTEHYPSDFNIPSSSSTDPEFYDVKHQFNSSFDGSEECKVVKPSEVFPSFHREQEVERPIRSVLSSHNTNFATVKIKSEYPETKPIKSEPPEPIDKDVYLRYLPKRLKPIDMVKRDHCYHKILSNDQPEAPVPAPSPLWNTYLGDMNKVEVPVKRRPGRPRKSTTSVPTERHTRVTVQKPPQKRARKPSQATSKRQKLNNGSSVRNDKREQHNRAERERRFALRNSMISVAGQCPEHVLHLTNIALTATKHNRSEEEIENNFTVEVVRRVDELVKRGDYDIKKLRSKKSQNFSKMIMLLSITYTIISLEKDLKVKESRLSYNENLLKQARNKLYRRTRVY